MTEQPYENAELEYLVENLMTGEEPTPEAVRDFLAQLLPDEPIRSDDPRVSALVLELCRDLTITTAIHDAEVATRCAAWTVAVVLEAKLEVAKEASNAIASRVRELGNIAIAANKILPPSTVMSQDDYIKNKGVACPFCSSQKVEAGPCNADGNVVTSEVTCHACGAEWTDQYYLAGFTLPGR